MTQQTGWQPQALPALPEGSTYAVTAVSALNENEAWIAGNIKPSGDAFVAHTTNGGGQWQVVHRSVMAGVTRLKMMPGVGIIAGTHNLLRSSTDGGATWIQEQNSIPNPPGTPHNVGPDGHVYGLAVADSAHIWTAGYDGYSAGVIYHRKPERPQPDPQNPNGNTPWWLEWAQDYRGMYGIAAANSQIAWAVGYAGYIWMTVNGGDGWGQQTSNTGAALNDVVALDVNTAWVVGDGGVILKTTDGGATWNSQPSGTTENLRRIAAVDVNVAWAVGTNGTILRTTDGGATWRAQVSGTDATFNGVAAVNATTAWVVSESALPVLATTDGGTDQPLSVPAINYLSPLGGPITGGTGPIDLMGRDFRPGVRVYFGNVPAAAVQFRAANWLNVTTPAHAAGIVDITVVNPDGQSATKAKAFAFADTQPLILSLSPSYGYVNEQVDVTINGAGFMPSVTATEPVPTVNINGTPVNGLWAGYDYLSITFSSSLLTTAGMANISVTTAAGTSNTVPFAINNGNVSVDAPNSPTLPKSVTLPSLSGPIEATFYGMNWGGWIKVGKVFDPPEWLAGNSPPPAGYSFLRNYYYEVSASANLSYKEATLCFPYADADIQAAGLDESKLRLLRYQSDSSTWEDVTFTLDRTANVICGTSPRPMAYFALAQGPQETPAPVITAITPAIGPPAGGTTVTISGNRFGPNATVAFGSAAATNVTVVNGRKITVTIPAHVSGFGFVDVVVTHPDSRTGTVAGGFEYVGPPSVISVSPPQGKYYSAVTITGMGFRDGSGLSITFGGAQLIGYSVINETTIEGNAPSHAAGPVDIVVTNPDGQAGTLANGFTYIPAPTITNVEPNAGPVEGGTSIIITGTGFQTGATVVFAETAAATDVTVVNSTTITAVTPAHNAGAVNVKVTNPDTQYAYRTPAFTYGKWPSVITWTPPASIPFGTTLGAAQLNATVNGIPGTFVYSPAAGAILTIGTRTLSVTFTPTDTGTYTTTTKTVTIAVQPARGDVNADGSVNIADAIIALQILSAKQPAPATHTGADVNSDGNIGLQEAIYVLQTISVLR
jgi:photosystem II stability/assembly factor-like uncharacterized protein